MNILGEDRAAEDSHLGTDALTSRVDTGDDGRRYMNDHLRCYNDQGQAIHVPLRQLQSIQGGTQRVARMDVRVANVNRRLCNEAARQFVSYRQ